MTWVSSTLTAVFSCILCEMYSVYSTVVLLYQLLNEIKGILSPIPSFHSVLKIFFVSETEFILLLGGATITFFPLYYSFQFSCTITTTSADCGSFGSITQSVVLQPSNPLVTMFFLYLHCYICLFTLSLATEYHKVPNWVSWVL